MNFSSDSVRVSILMPAYNAEKFVDAAISSILEQTYRNFELLIADDGSVDDTRAVIERYHDKRIRFFSNEENRGYVWTCNFLYSKAEGSVIGFQDADDISHPQRLETQLALLNDNTNSFCGCDMRYMRFNGKLLNVTSQKSIAMKLEWPRIGDSTLIIFKEQLERIGGLYRPYFSNNQDYDLGLRLLDCFTYKNLDRPYYYYRNVPYSNSKDYSSPEKVVNGDLVRLLAKQRRDTGRDYLMEGNLEAIQKVRTGLVNAYQVDKTMMERRAVSYLLSIGMYSYAFKISLRAIRKEPLSVSVYRALLYVVRTTIVVNVSPRRWRSQREKQTITHVSG